MRRWREAVAFFYIYKETGTVPLLRLETADCKILVNLRAVITDDGLLAV
ncbi:MAG: hypothetical protein KHY54_09240 [Roseburia sp.]|nr:hypothetical protein [Roseburia sp.]